MDDSVAGILDKSMTSQNANETKVQRPITQIRRNGLRLTVAPSPTVDKVFLNLKAEGRAFVAAQSKSGNRHSV